MKLMNLSRPLDVCRPPFECRLDVFRRLSCLRRVLLRVAVVCAGYVNAIVVAPVCRGEPFLIYPASRGLSGWSYHPLSLE
jgi:hypothetical protein